MIRLIVSKHDGVVSVTPDLLYFLAKVRPDTIP